MKIRIAFAIVLATLSIRAFAERADTRVLLMDIRYTDGRWSASPSALLACEGPSKPDAFSNARSMYLLRGRDGKVLLQRYLTNPRIILIEDRGARLLDQLRFTLSIAIPQTDRFRASEVASFEFYEEGLDVRNPSTTVKFERGLASVRTGDSAPCQVPMPDFARRRPLRRDSGDAISPRAFGALLRFDRGAVIRWGIENGITPETLQRLVKRNQGVVADLAWSDRQIDALVAEYTAAFRRSRPLKK